MPAEKLVKGLRDLWGGHRRLFTSWAPGSSIRRLRYPTMGGIKLTAVYETEENGWIQARIEELPAVITAAPTLTQAKALLRDALGEYLASLRTSTSIASPNAEREQLELLIH